jgi:tRNA1(Val) A37 N6-methylase TrmN6
MELTEDYILDGKIFLLQPREGYRVAVDPVIFSHFINIERGRRVLDVGCGAGAISLILKWQAPDSEVFAIDVDKNICEVCVENAQRNNLKINVINIGIERIQTHHELKDIEFDYVVTNPPFFDSKSSRVSSMKRIANFETVELKDWVSFCLKKVKNNGEFAIIHCASRIDDIFSAVRGKIGAVEIIPIFPKYGSDAKRVIIKGRKGSKSPAKITSGLILHNDDGEYSETTEKILRGFKKQQH